MNELFLIPGIIISVLTIWLGRIRKMGNKLVLSLIILLFLSSLVFFVVFFNTSGWNRLGYGIFAYISGVSLISSIITVILQRKMIKLFMVIVGLNILALMLSIAALGTTNSLTSKFQALLYINLIVVLINLIFKYLSKFLRR